MLENIALKLPVICKQLPEKISKCTKLLKPDEILTLNQIKSSNPSQQIMSAVFCKIEPGKLDAKKESDKNPDVITIV